MKRTLSRVVVQGDKYEILFKVVYYKSKSQMQYKISFWLTSLGQFVTAFTSFLAYNLFSCR